MIAAAVYNGNDSRFIRGYKYAVLVNRMSIYVQENNVILEYDNLIDFCSDWTVTNKVDTKAAFNALAISLNVISSSFVNACKEVEDRINNAFKKHSETTYEYKISKILEAMPVLFIEEEEKIKHIVPRTIKRKNPIIQFNKKKFITHRRK